MKHPQQQLPHTAQSSGQNKVAHLFSSYLFFELFGFKKYHDPMFLIPDTILLQKGLIKEWLFNSSKHQNKILKKKRQNSTPLNVIKSFCLTAGYNFSHCTTMSQLRAQFAQLRKQQHRKQSSTYKPIQQKKLVQVITTEDQTLSMPLWDFVNLVADGRFNEHTFYQRWKIIRQKVNNQSRIDQCYQVVSTRRNHSIQSKCHKVIAIKTGQLTPMSSVQLQFDNFKQVTPPRSQHITQTKAIQGYKFFDTFLNKKFFTIAQQLVEFIQKNYKCIVEEIKTKYVINKNREPYLVGISQLVIKPIRKICTEGDFDQYLQKGYVKIDEYMRCLNFYLVEHEKQQKANNLVANVIKKAKCNGDFCKIKVKKIPHLSSQPGAAGRAKHFNLDPAVHPMHKRTVFSDVVNAVRKRKTRVLQKLKQYDIIDYNPQQQLQQSSQYEQSDEQTHKNIKVCENCHSLYMHIQRFYQIDFRSGNLIQKKESMLLNNQNLKIRSHSEKRLPPILNKTEIEKPSKQLGDDLGSKKDDDEISRGNRLKSIEASERAKTFTLRSKSHAKLQSNQSSRDKESHKEKQKLSTNNNKLSKFQDLKKIKLDPIDIPTTTTAPSKANRLLALSKSIHNSPITAINNRLNKNEIKMSKQPKAKNYQQAQQNLLQRLQKLPSSSIQEFTYYAVKYFKDNLPQQPDRKCFSSQYINNFYSFMMNSELNLHSKNRIRKRPQISLKRLSELTDYPQIVSKSAFHFDTLITDQKTTITFCVITTRMINGTNTVNTPFQNIFICHDIFDCFIEYIPLIKDILQNSINKRVIMFNYPGQSHTIYNKETPMNLQQFSFVIDKLIYRLSTQKEQLGFVNFRKDRFKFIGVGYGGYLLSSYLANSYQFYGKNLSGVMLINTYKNISQTIKQKAQALRTLYASDDQVATSQAFLFYSKAILSSQTDKDDLQYKSGLNPIRLEGRVHLLDSLLDMATLQHNHANTMIYTFQDITHCPVHIVYGRMNVLFTKVHAQRFMVYEDTKVKKQDIPHRKFVEIEGGHDLLADNYDDLERYVEAFVLL